MGANQSNQRPGAEASVDVKSSSKNVAQPEHGLSGTVAADTITVAVDDAVDAVDLYPPRADLANVASHPVDCGSSIASSFISLASIDDLARTSVASGVDGPVPRWSGIWPQAGYPIGVKPQPGPKDNALHGPNAGSSDLARRSRSGAKAVAKSSLSNAVAAHKSAATPSTAAMQNPAYGDDAQEKAALVAVEKDAQGREVVTATRMRVVTSPTASKHAVVSGSKSPSSPTSEPASSGAEAAAVQAMQRSPLGAVPPADTAAPAPGGSQSTSPTKAAPPALLEGEVAAVADADMSAIVTASGTPQEPGVVPVAAPSPGAPTPVSGVSSPRAPVADAPARVAAGPASPRPAHAPANEAATVTPSAAGQNAAGADSKLVAAAGQPVPAADRQPTAAATAAAAAVAVSPRSASPAASPAAALPDAAVAGAGPTELVLGSIFDGKVAEEQAAAAALTARVFAAVLGGPAPINTVPHGMVTRQAPPLQAADSAVVTAVPGSPPRHKSVANGSVSAIPVVPSMVSAASAASSHAVAAAPSGLSDQSALDNAGAASPPAMDRLRSHRVPINEDELGEDDELASSVDASAALPLTAGSGKVEAGVQPGKLSASEEANGVKAANRAAVKGEEITAVDGAADKGAAQPGGAAVKVDKSVKAKARGLLGCFTCLVPSVAV